MDLKRYIKIIATGFDYDRYWHRRDKVFDSKTSCIIRAYYKFYLRRVDAKNGADINIVTELGNNFQSHPILPHGIKGIVIAGGTKVGKNVTISHQVTIGRSRNLVPEIGDNVYIGPGAKIFGGIKVGKNVRIGANCVVFQDVPDNATVVLEKPRIIIKEQGYQYFTFDIDKM